MNPCPGGWKGGPGPPDTWEVEWSEDPEKKRRQLDYIIDSMGKASAERWRDYFDTGYEDIDPADFLEETQGAHDVSIEAF